MNPLARKLIVSGALVCGVAPVAGIFVTVLSMMRAFRTLSQNGVNDPTTLANHIGSVLTLSMVGFIVALLVGVPLIVAGGAIHFTTRPSAHASALPGAR